MRTVILTVHLMVIERQQCSELCNWLWPKLLQQKLNEVITFRNGVRIRHDKNKPGPSGMSRNTAFALPERWGGRNCLLPVDINVIREIKAAMGGDSLISFSTPEYAARAQEIYDSLGIVELGFDNIWDVFADMKERMYGSSQD